MICSICIATYKRIQLLRGLLNSIFAQNLPQNIKIQIVVVDNDLEKSAEVIFKNFKSNDKIWLEYYNQTKKKNTTSVLMNYNKIKMKSYYLSN